MSDWNVYLKNLLKKFLIYNFLRDKTIVKMLSALSIQDIVNVLVGHYYISNLSYSIVPLTKDNIFLFKETILQAAEEALMELNNNVPEDVITTAGGD